MFFAVLAVLLAVGAIISSYLGFGAAKGVAQAYGLVTFSCIVGAFAAFGAACK